MVREAIEDIMRAQSDIAQNNQKVFALKNA